MSDRDDGTSQSSIDWVEYLGRAWMGSNGLSGSRASGSRPSRHVEDHRSAVVKQTVSGMTDRLLRPPGVAELLLRPSGVAEFSGSGVVGRVCPCLILVLGPARSGIVVDGRLRVACRLGIVGVHVLPVALQSG